MPLVLTFFTQPCNGTKEHGNGRPPVLFVRKSPQSETAPDRRNSLFGG